MTMEQDKFIASTLDDATHYQDATGTIYPLMMSGYPRLSISKNSSKQFDGIWFSNNCCITVEMFSFFGITPMKAAPPREPRKWKVQMLVENNRLYTISVRDLRPTFGTLVDVEVTEIINKS